MTKDLTPDLTGELTRAKEAATAGIVIRSDDPEFSEDSGPVDGISGAAKDDDDRSLDDPDDDGVPVGI
jgi:hypothetical protein